MTRLIPLIGCLLGWPLLALSQTVQERWLDPKGADGETELQLGSSFTLLWRSELKSEFAEWCKPCDTAKLDLWVTSFNGMGYRKKIGRLIDLNSKTSFQWTVDVGSGWDTDTNTFVFRFTYQDSLNPFTTQVSSPGFKIKGLLGKSSSQAPATSPATSSTGE